MGFLQDIFKRKPGGTTVGNILRGFASAYTGGALGNGRMMISELDADKRDLSDADFSVKYGMTKALAIPGTLPLEKYRASGGAASPSSALAFDLFMAKVKQYWYIPVAIIGFFVALFTLNRRRYGRR